MLNGLNRKNEASAPRAENILFYSRKSEAIYGASYKSLRLKTYRNQQLTTGDNWINIHSYYRTAVINKPDRLGVRDTLWSFRYKLATSNRGPDNFCTLLQHRSSTPLPWRNHTNGLETKPQGKGWNKNHVFDWGSWNTVAISPENSKILKQKRSSRFLIYEKIR